MPTAAAAEGLSLRTGKGRLALTATVAASGMASLDATIVTIALPQVGNDFGVSVTSLQWVLTGYLLALASLVLLAGALGDRFGRRRIFILGTVWFAAASVLCGIAPNLQSLIAGRILQGVGGALLTPGSLSIIQADFRPLDRARAVGAWSGLSGVAAAIGPFAGGALVDGPGWRWAFLLNVPVAVVVVMCAHAAIPNAGGSRAGGALDLVGSLIATVGLAAATWALTEVGRRGWGDGLVGTAGAVAVSATGLFVWRMLHSENPLVSPSLFRNRVFTVINIATVLLYGGLGVAFFLVVYQLQVAVGWSALKASAVLLPVTGLTLALSEPSGVLAERIGPRLQLTVGPLLVAAGLLMLSRIGPHAAWPADVLPGVMVFGLGLVAFVAPLTASVMATATPDHVSVASAVNNAVARVGALVALAIVPPISGLSQASGAAEVTDAFRLGMVITAIGVAVAGVVSFLGLTPQTRAVFGWRRVHCSIDGAPLQPDHAWSVPQSLAHVNDLERSMPVYRTT